MASRTPSTSLDPAGTEKVAQICGILGCETDEAETLLRLSQGSIEKALNLHMEGVSVSQDSTSAALGSDEPEVRAPIAPKQETLVQSWPAEGAGQRGGLSNPHRQRIRTVFDGFRDFDSETRDYTDPGAGTPADAGGAKRSLPELFKPPIDMTFKGDLQSARDQAVQGRQWLLVNIQDPREFRCQMLNRDVWSVPAVKMLVREHFVFWQQYRESVDAQRYMTFYPVSQWPHVAILDPLTGEAMIKWPDIGDSECFQALVAAFFTVHSESPTGLKSESNEKSREPTPKKFKQTVPIIDANEDAQLAAAIQASLANDPSPNIKTPDDGQSLPPGGSNNLEHNQTVIESGQGSWRTTANSLAKHREVPKNNCQELRSPEKSETTQSSLTTQLGPIGDAPSHLLIRFPNGKKERKILPSSSLLLAILTYITEEGYSLERYEIVANFPRRVFTEMEKNKTLKDLGMFPKETIYIQHKPLE